MITGTRVTGIAVDRGRVRGVRTEDGAIAAEVVVNAGGIYAAEIGRLAGVRVPVVPLLHQYVITEPFMGPDEKGEALPTLRDLDGLIYVRPEGKGLAMGGYHADATPWSLGPGGLDAVPDGFHYRVVEPDWRRFEPLLLSARRRVPAFRTAAFARLVNGPEAFTPDGEFILGETAVGGFFVAAGFCAHGVAGSGGVGKVMAEWIAGGEPPMDLWGMDIRRFGAHFGSPSYTVARANEVYETYYSIAYPGTERQAGRPLRVSPVYEWHRAHGAAFGEKAGWERVNYYEANAPAGDPTSRPKGWAGRLGGRHRGRAPGRARARRALRRVVLRQDRGPRPRRRGLPRAHVRQRGRRTGGWGQVHADAQSARGHRVGSDRKPVRARSVLAGDRDGVRHPRPRVAPDSSAGAWCGADRHHLGLRLLRVVGSAGEGNTPGLLARGPGQRGLSLSHPTVDPGRERAGRSAPRQLRG